jgi:hypothetical protein
LICLTVGECRVTHVLLLRVGLGQPSAQGQHRAEGADLRAALQGLGAEFQRQPVQDGGQAVEIDFEAIDLGVASWGLEQHPEAPGGLDRVGVQRGIQPADRQRRPFQRRYDRSGDETVNQGRSRRVWGFGVPLWERSFFRCQGTSRHAAGHPNEK